MLARVLVATDEALTFRESDFEVTQSTAHKAHRKTHTLSLFPSIPVSQGLDLNVVFQFLTP